MQVYDCIRSLLAAFCMQISKLGLPDSAETSETRDDSQVPPKASEVRDQAVQAKGRDIARAFPTQGSGANCWQCRASMLRPVTPSSPCPQPLRGSGYESLKPLGTQVQSNASSNNMLLSSGVGLVEQTVWGCLGLGVPFKLHL